MRFRLLLAAFAAVMLFTGCASAPPPDWALQSHSALQRAVAAYLDGNDRVGDMEFSLARAELSRTARPELVARAELLRCATQVASLVFGPCAGYQALQADAAPAEQAYARYLRAQTRAGDMELLPPAQREVARSLVGGTAVQPATLAGQADPLSRLVAVSVLLQAGQASPAMLELATQTASEQGWRRPLMAWLSAQLRLAEQSQATESAQRLRRRIELLQTPARP